LVLRLTVEKVADVRLESFFSFPKSPFPPAAADTGGTTEEETGMMARAMSDQHQSWG
jgi:hypothetical protein